MKVRVPEMAQDLGLSIRCMRPIVDIETTKEVARDWRREEFGKADICCVGILSANQITQVYREPFLEDVNVDEIKQIILVSHVQGLEQDVDHIVRLENGRVTEEV